ncbi:nucleoside-diphosphate sugar epimerase/dehydratase [Alkalihalobacillus trypoxylicola]|uniref:Polysaccharide biosynthesis protein CapD-like domain-containing protein n=1 Tax=Alkalihalobacillus trypoxylicola TaxID=519424 RepID=A0A161P6C9_9BACI|nr:nucleoside-diphosphate sugar epimerase/dehydratase [Alkalihalobacillus trypoxylicola]KYG27667.1 hypothetical protein AZF04_10780 [Alkalihalobacillus trypoxylicola]
MSYYKRLVLFVSIDFILIGLAIIISAFLVGTENLIAVQALIGNIIAIYACYYLLSIKYHFYKKAWEYVSVGELFILSKTLFLSFLFVAVFQQLVWGEVFLRFLFTSWMMQMLLIGGSRFVWRTFRDSTFIKEIDKKRTLIIGAGSAGMMVARQLKRNNPSEFHVVSFIDDDTHKHQLEILGIPVYGGSVSIRKAVEELKIDHIIIAIPSLSKKRLHTIYEECAKTVAKTKILPRIEDIVTGKLNVTQFRDVEVEDLLGREPVELDIDGISEYITNKTVLVTGAGGSIGSEICRQVSQFAPKTLILLGHGENSIYSIEMELKENFQNSSIKFLTEIADIQDSEKMTQIMKKYRPSVVYHAAAHKHVPLMERNPEEAVKNNIIGTKNVADAANWSGVDTFVMLSSDKAVNPTSVMGATKRLAEMIIQDIAKKSNTKFIAVRFGNVLGSRGSVIPLFKNQIKMGGPLTVTHPEMVRYFMTIPEASKLVLQAGSLARGGEIFVLDMGKPIKIVDLAKNLITLSGHNVDEIGIEFSGKREGEKLFEELLNENEIHDKQIFPKIYIGKASELFMEEINEVIENFNQLEAMKLASTLVSLANRKEKTKLEMKDKVLSIPG